MPNRLIAGNQNIQYTGYHDIGVNCHIKEYHMKPNQGSDAALDQGCTCPVLDNGHGRLNNGKGPFWTTEGCPVHAPVKENRNAQLQIK